MPLWGVGGGGYAKIGNSSNEMAIFRNSFLDSLFVPLGLRDGGRRRQKGQPRKLVPSGLPLSACRLPSCLSPLFPPFCPIQPFCEGQGLGKLRGKLSVAKGRPQEWAFCRFPPIFLYFDLAKVDNRPIPPSTNNFSYLASPNFRCSCAIHCSVLAKICCWD